MRDYGRWAIVTLGATVALIIYRILLESLLIELPFDAPHRLLLAASGVAACMVGAAATILILDRRR